MKQSSRTFAKILFSLAFLANLAVATGFDQSAQNGFRYGPNLSWSFVGNTPFVWGQWYPQLMGNLHYTWLEPLDELSYGDPMERTPTYLKMEAAIEASPFYGGYQVGLGIRPFKTNPQVEVNVLYESFLYFYSNLEMVNADVAGEGRIAESWNADYIADNVWQSEAATFDYAQLFDMGVSLEYIFAGGSHSLNVEVLLVVLFSSLDIFYQQLNFSWLVGVVLYGVGNIERLLCLYVASLRTLSECYSVHHVARL